MSAIDYIKKYGLERGLFINEAAEKISDYFEVLPENFEETPYKDWILETLNSHDRSKLKNTLKKKFNIKEFFNASGERTSKLSAFSFIFDPELYTLEKYDGKKLSDEEFENLEIEAIEDLENTIKFFGWYVSKVFNSFGESRWFVSPTYAQNKTNYIKTTCKGYVYHLCGIDSVDSILSNGLRCKTPMYRYFPERIYVVGADPRNIKRVINDLVHGELDHLNDSNTYVLKIKIGNEDYYTDDIMESTHTFYTYNNIPAKNIEESYKLYDFLEGLN